jgi:hypothetical protein
MKTLNWKHLIPILIFVIVAACGGGSKSYNPGGSGGGGSGGGGSQSEQAIPNFSTRINDQLLIAGTQCQGGETTTDANGLSATCLQNQWLITLDDTNTCTNGASCTQFVVTPFIADLVLNTTPGVPGVSFYDIVPVSSVTDHQTSTIQTFFVRVDQTTGDTTVVSK